jgi:hypothetical protein
LAIAPKVVAAAVAASIFATFFCSPASIPCVRKLGAFAASVASGCRSDFREGAMRKGLALPPHDEQEKTRKPLRRKDFAEA